MANNQNTVGTDNLKSLIQFLTLCVIEVSTIDADKNKKISLAEMISAITSIGFKIPGLMGSIPHIKEEWKDLTADELKALAEWFAEQFDLPGLETGKLELLIKKSVTILVTNYNYYRDIKAILAA